MAEPVHLAFLGCGGITASHSRTLAALDSDVVRYYASRDHTKADAYNRKFGGAGAFGSYEAALADERIGVVLVATPPDSHLDLSVRALDARKHVIIEKPPLLRAADFDVIEAAERRSGRRAFVAENYFYRPLVESLRGIIASGALGEIRFLAVNALKEQRSGDWRDDPAMAGGGALFEGGVHWINFIANLGLTVREVAAFRPGDGRGIERSIVVVARYESGAVGTLFHSWEIPSLFKGLRLSRIYGTEGSVTFESNGLVVVVRSARRKRVLVPGFKDIRGFRAMFSDFLEAIRTGREPRMTLARARRDLELIEAAYRSAEQ